MGCIKLIVKIIVFILALIGLNSLMGDKVNLNDLNIFKGQSQMQKQLKARKIADFDDLSEKYVIDNTANFLGYKMILAEHKQSGQKLALIDPGIVPLLTKKDFRSGEADKKILDLNKKLKYQYIRIDDLQFTEKGSFSAMEQKIPYIKFEAKTVNLPVSNITGIVAAAKNTEDKDIIIASVNEKGKYSQAVARDFFGKFK